MPRRILLLITDLEIGGTPTVVRELATRLNAPPEVEVEVACLSRWGPLADQITAAGVTVTALGARHAWQLPSVIQRLRGLLREKGFDTVFSFLLHANAAAALAARRITGVRFLQSIQTVQPWPRWHWWVQRRIQGRAENVVVPSSAVAAMARQASGVPAAKIVVIPNAISPAEFPRVAVFKGDAIRIGFLGRLDFVKNLPEFVSAVGLLRSKYVVEGHIFGAGGLREPIDHLIRLYGHEKYVFLRGQVGCPQAALREMDLLLFPSGGEGFGLVLIEAMASGVPVVALARGGVTDVVTHEHNGLLAVRRDDRLLAEQVERLISDPSLRNTLIQNGLKTVAERFNWHVVLPQYRVLLDVPN